jgi:hypothetical protein
MGAVYKITFPDGLSYIGSTKHSIKRRMSEHKADCVATFNKSRPIHSAIDKFGIDLSMFEILFSSDEIELLRKTEIEFMRQHNTLIPNGLNVISYR